MLILIYLYTTVPVSERPDSIKNPVCDGHSVRFATDLNDSESHIAGYDTITKFQNLGYDTIISIRLKSAEIRLKSAKSPPGVRYSDPKVPRTCLTAPASVRQVL